LLLDHVPLAAKRALDLGCGTGFPLLELAERLGPGASVIGLDPWWVALRRAAMKRQLWRVPQTAIVNGDGAAMPFRAAHFDLVVSNLGINNFADADAAFAECRRVLRPGGVLAMTSNLVGHMRELYEMLERVLEGDAAGLERLRRHVDHRGTVATLTARLERAGLRVVAVHEREVALRFAGAEALLDHHFIRLGFRPAWEEVAGSPEAFARLRAELGRRSVAQGGLRLTVPLAYLEAAAP
jgi:ubiquinone/menaquinone biosynthesis C-methylase UbiE